MINSNMTTEKSCMDVLDEANTFVLYNLMRLCQELKALNDTGNLDQHGKLAQLRNILKSTHTSDSLRVSRHLVMAAAVEYVANLTYA